MRENIEKQTTGYHRIQFNTFQPAFRSFHPQNGKIGLTKWKQWDLESSNHLPLVRCLFLWRGPFSKATLCSSHPILQLNPPPKWPVRHLSNQLEAESHSWAVEPFCRCEHPQSSSKCEEDAAKMLHVYVFQSAVLWRRDKTPITTPLATACWLGLNKLRFCNCYRGHVSRPLSF